jgi:hypothetical protein
LADSLLKQQHKSVRLHEVAALGGYAEFEHAPLRKGTLLFRTGAYICLVQLVDQNGDPAKTGSSPPSSTSRRRSRRN